MKAGIYKVDNEPVWIYVSKDRTIKAISHPDLEGWVGKKAVTKQIGQVVIFGNKYECTRVSDVTNGTHDHELALLRYVDTLHPDKPENGALPCVINYDRKTGKPDMRPFSKLAWLRPTRMEQHDSISGGEPAPVLDQPAQVYVGNAQRLDINESAAEEGFIVPNDGTRFVGSHEIPAAEYRDITILEDQVRTSVKTFSGLDTNRNRTNIPVDMTAVSDAARKSAEGLKLANALTKRARIQMSTYAAALAFTSEEIQAGEDLRAGKFRLCHNQSARKHKKRKDREVWFHPVFNCYAWRKVA